MVKLWILEWELPLLWNYFVSEDKTLRGSVACTSAGRADGLEGTRVISNAHNHCYVLSFWNKHNEILAQKLACLETNLQNSFC